MKDIDEIKKELKQLNHRMELIHQDVLGRVPKKKLLTAREVGNMLSLDHRTILNRTHLSPTDKRYIPSVKFPGRKKYFERVVIEKMFNLSSSGGQS